jgi:hypothetical protein
LGHFPSFLELPLELQDDIVLEMLDATSQFILAISSRGFFARYQKRFVNAYPELGFMERVFFNLGACAYGNLTRFFFSAVERWHRQVLFRGSLAARRLFEGALTFDQVTPFHYLGPILFIATILKSGSYLVIF